MTTTTTTFAAPVNRQKAMLDEIAKKVVEIQSSKDWMKILDAGSAFWRYSFNNVLLIWMQRPTATLVGGAGNCWRGKFKRNIKKGEKAIWILAPMLKNNPPEEVAQGAPEKRLIGWKPVPVFDIEQTEGEPMPKTSVEQDGDAPRELIVGTIKLIEAQGFSMEFKDCGKADGVTFYPSKTVVIQPHMGPARTMKTLLHELAHVLMHEPSSDGREVVEVEAESVSYIVTRTLGITPDCTYSFNYIAQWSHKDPGAVERSGEKILKTARKILTELGVEGGGKG